MNKERWRDIAGWDGMYQVSDLGRVRSLDRSVVYRNGARRVFKGRIRKTSLTGKRGPKYESLVFQSGKRRETFKVHRLVAAAFIGITPAGMETAHTDGNQLNNRLSNLRYVTHAENESDKRRHGTHGAGEQSHFARLTWASRSRIFALSDSGMSQRKIAAIYGVNQGTISYMLSGKTWPSWADPERT